MLSLRITHVRKNQQYFHWPGLQNGVDLNSDAPALNDSLITTTRKRGVNVTVPSSFAPCWKEPRD